MTESSNGLGAAVTGVTEPGSARLYLDAHPSIRRSVDGAWWPHSRDVESEIAQLVTAAGPLIGRVDRVGLCRPDWPDHPRRISVDGRVLPLGFFGSGANLIHLARARGDDVILLVVPPEFAADAAACVIERAVDSEDRSTPAALLAGGMA